MEQEQLYRELCWLAEKLDITVTEKNLKNEAPAAKSGVCRLAGRYHLILDKKELLETKIDLLLDCLSRVDIEGVYVLPAIRELLAEYNSGKR